MVLTVIVVDQNDEVCERLAQALDRLPGVRVLAHTTNLMLAAELAHQFTPDSILADFKRNGADRPEALQWLRQMSPASSIVIHSSFYTEGEREAFTEAGADLCLLKGMGVKALAGQLAQAARSGDRPRAPGSDVTDRKVVTPGA